jgi:adenylate kinase
MVAKKHTAVLLFGPPGVGKGTQGQILGNIPGFFHHSSGDVFRSLAIGSTEGKEVYRYISKGQLVPDELTMTIWRKSLEGQIGVSAYKPYEDLLVLDGIPRNVRQAELLEAEVDVRRVVQLYCGNEEQMIHRIKRRAIRENRVDDANEQVIRQRFAVYHEQSKPVLGYYPQDMIFQVDAMRSPAEVLKQVLEVLIPVQNELYRGGSPFAD